MVQGSGLRVQGLGSRVQGRRLAGADMKGSGILGGRPTSASPAFGFRLWGLGFRVSGFRFRVAGLGFLSEGFGLRVSGLGVRLQVLV